MADPRKAELRSRLLAARRALPDPALRAAALRVQAEVMAFARGHPGTVACYVPYRTEPGGPDLPGVLARAGFRLLLPVLLDDKDLDWAVPDGPPLGVAAIREASLIVVPALAVDRAGVRLGRGGGSYDRALARVPPGAEVVALLHDGELLDDPLPAAPHDRPVTAAITPGHGLVRPIAGR
jgi:5-formyltetrahydrofolate cyclo-ligase